MAARTSRGRQRIEMVKIEKKNSLEVTFSKRRAGLFKKASVLSTLCGVDVAIIVFSPAGNKVFSFGHPNVEAVMERFLGEDNPAPVKFTLGVAVTPSFLLIRCKLPQRFITDFVIDVRVENWGVTSGIDGDLLAEDFDCSFVITFTNMYPLDAFLSASPTPLLSSLY